MFDFNLILNITNDNNSIERLQMKEFCKSYSLIVIVASSCISMFVTLPSQADPKKQEQPTRTVRATTGIEAVQGWEQGLVKGNPNLARWHWDPIYSYKQGYMKLPVQNSRPDVAKNGSTGNKQVLNNNNKPAFQYPVGQGPDTRPKHIPFSPQALEEVRAKLSQPEKPIMPANQIKREEKVSAHLTQPAKENIPKEPELSTYGELYSRRENLGTALKYHSEKTSVYGQLLNAKEKSRYNGAKVIKQQGH